MSTRILQNMDLENTRLLNLDELYVENVECRSNGLLYNVWLKDPELDACPFCGSTAFRNQGMFSKDFRDMIPLDNGYQDVLLHFHFYKYCCTNPDCRKLFAKAIHFADRNDRLTYRAEEQIARMVMSGMSFGQINTIFSKPLSRQGVSDVFQRWVIRKEDQRQTPHPSSLAIFSGTMEDKSYILFLGLDHGINVLDILLDAGPMEITAKLREYGTENIGTVLTDCSPVVSETVMDLLPNATCIVPVQCWFAEVTKEFRTFVRSHARRSSLHNNAHYCWEPESSDAFHQDAIRAFLDTRPKIEQPYRDYRELCTILYDRENPWTFSALTAWENTICDDLRQTLKIPLMLLQQNRAAIYEHEKNRDTVPPLLQQKAAELEECIKQQKTFCEEVLRARVLYSTNDKENNGQGVPLDAVLDALHSLNGKNENTTGGNIDDYK